MLQICYTLIVLLIAISYPQRVFCIMTSSWALVLCVLQPAFGCLTYTQISYHHKWEFPSLFLWKFKVLQLEVMDNVSKRIQIICIG